MLEMILNPNILQLFFLVYLALTAILSAEQNGLYHFGRCHEKNFCEINLNKNQWLRRCYRKIFFLIFSSDGHFIQQQNGFCNFSRGHNEKTFL